MRNTTTEFVGTFLFVFAIALSVTYAGAAAPLAIGAALMCVVYMGGHISGGHYNPAVTLAVYLRGRISADQAFLYVCCQFLGAILAAVLAALVTEHSFLAAPPQSVSLTSAIIVETVFSFALCLVVLNVATDDSVRGNSYYGLAIGFTVTVAAFAGGSVSGGAFNPAVGIGPALVAVGKPIGHIWIYAVGPLLGAALAAGTYRIQHPRTAVVQSP